LESQNIFDENLEEKIGRLKTELTSILNRKSRVKAQIDKEISKVAAQIVVNEGASAFASENLSMTPSTSSKYLNKIITNMAKRNKIFVDAFLFVVTYHSTELGVPLTTPLHPDTAIDYLPVDPRRTSQVCSVCQTLVKSLSDKNTKQKFDMKLDDWNSDVQVCRNWKSSIDALEGKKTQFTTEEACAIDEAHRYAMQDLINSDNWDFPLGFFPRHQNSAMNVAKRHPKYEK